jgi:hypothetical protein
VCAHRMLDAVDGLLCDRTTDHDAPKGCTYSSSRGSELGEGDRHGREGEE